MGAILGTATATTDATATATATVTNIDGTEEQEKETENTISPTNTNTNNDVVDNDDFDDKKRSLITATIANEMTTIRHAKKQRLLEEVESIESTTVAVTATVANDHKKISVGESNVDDHDIVMTTAVTSTASTTPAPTPSCIVNSNEKKKKDLRNSNPPDDDAPRVGVGDSSDGRVKWKSKASTAPKAKSSRSSKKIKTKNLDPRILVVRKTIQDGCRTNNLQLAMDAYLQAIQDNVRIEPQSYYNLLNLCDGLDRKERGLHVGSPKLGLVSNHPIIPVDIAATSTTTTTNQQQQQKQSVVPSSSENNTTTTTTTDTIITSNSIDLQKRQEYIFMIKERMQSKEINLPLNETAYTAIVKILSKNQNYEKAEEILNEAEQVQQCKPKLRLYSSLLNAYCCAHEQQQQHDLNNVNDTSTSTNTSTSKLIPALRCWKRLRQRASIIRSAAAAAATTNFSNSGSGSSTNMELTEREYISLLKCAVHTNNQLVMEDVLTRIAEDINIPAKDTVSIITKWFETQNQLLSTVDSTVNIAADATNPSNVNTDHNTDNDNNNKVVQQLLDEIRSYDTVSEPSPRMGPVVTPPQQQQQQWIISHSCSIQTNGSGILMDGCLKDYALKPVPLSDESFNEMRQMNESIVVQGEINSNSNNNNKKNKTNSSSIYQGGKKGKKRNRNDDYSKQKRQTQWNNFKDFLVKNNPSTSLLSSLSTTFNSSSIALLQNRPYEVVIDGANIGYYKQNFGNGPSHVDYEQIDWIVRHFQYKLQKRVLLVMHNRHFSHQMMPAKFRPLVENWIQHKILYQTPAGMNDDWFWMHAALQYKTLVVTNDEMRDHHFQMLAPKFFLRWKERHQIHFEFGDWCTIQQQQNNNNDHVGNTGNGGGGGNNINNNNSSSYYQRRQGRQREVILNFPNKYSRRIQRVGGDGLVIPLTKRGDENRFLDGCHIANENEPNEERYLCIRSVVQGQQPVGPKVKAS